MDPLRSNVKGSEKTQTELESEWVKKVQESDAGAFKELFSVYCQPLVHFVYRLVGDVSIAENLVQDVFLKVWENRSGLDPSLNIKTYLYTAVKHRAFKHIKHIDVERRGAETLKRVNNRPRSPEVEWFEKERADHVRRAVEELPAKRKMIFCMSRYDHLTYAEIAHILNISIKTVETQMGRALKHLRNRLAYYFYEM